MKYVRNNYHNLSFFRELMRDFLKISVPEIDIPKALSSDFLHKWAYIIELKT